MSQKNLFWGFSKWQQIKESISVRVESCHKIFWSLIRASLSSCRAISTDISDLLSSPHPIVHRLRRVFRATLYIGTELLYVGSSWSSCLCTSMIRGPQEYITYELVSTSPAVSCMFDTKVNVK